MGKIKMWGFILIFLSILLSFTNIFYMKITGAIIGAEVKSSFTTILTLVFLVLGMIFLSGLEKKTSNWIKAAAIAGTIAVVGIPAYNSRNEKIDKRIEDTVEIENKVKVVSPA